MKNFPLVGVSALILFATATTFQASPPPGLVSWWKGENNASDAAQGANNGTEQGTVSYAAGAVGQAFSLAGSGYVSVASPTFNSYTTGFTVAGWMKITALSGFGTASMINFRDASNNSGFTLEQLFNNPGSIAFDVAQAGAFNAISAPGWQLNTPYYIAATFDSATGTMVLYRNGSVVASRNDLSHTSMSPVGSPTFQIGRNISNGDGWNGLIDEVQFYDHALTPAEVALLSANIISDGGFENPILSSGEDRLFATGSTIGGVWTVLGTSGNTAAVALLQTNYAEPSNGVNQFNAQEGLNSVDLTGSANQGTMSGVEQTIATTIGQSYLVSFYVGRASGGASYATPSTVDLSINGGIRVSFTNSNSTPGALNWQQFTTSFLAAGTSTTLDFFNGQTTNAFTGLDNVVVSAKTTYDLRTQWSDSSNPNGVWAYREGSNNLPHLANWGNVFTSAQPAWARSDSLAAGDHTYLPAWFKVASQPSIALDFQVGDVGIHSTDGANGVGNGPANVIWTSPITSSVTLSGVVWEARNIGRSNHWSLAVNGTVITGGDISAGNSSRATPVDFSAGSGGAAALSNISVVPGDVIKLQIDNTSQSGDFVGMNFTVTPSSVPPSSFEAIFVANTNNGTIGEYSTSGAILNNALITGLDFPRGVAVSGTDLFVANTNAGKIAKYTTSGAVVNTSLVTGLTSPVGIAVSGGYLYVATFNANTPTAGTIGKYDAITGAVVNAALVTGLDHPLGIAVSDDGANLFVVAGGKIGEYTTSGGTVNTSLVTGLTNAAYIAVSGTNLFVTILTNNGTIGEYTTSGATVNAALVSGLNNPEGIAVSGTNLFVAGFYSNSIGEYTTSGATVNNALVSGLVNPSAVAIGTVSGTPPPPPRRLIFVSAGANIGAYDANSGAAVNAALIPKGTYAIVASAGKLFIGDVNTNTIGEYDAASGAVVNAALITGLDSPFALAISDDGANLFVLNAAIGGGYIGKYTTSGATVNASLVSGLGSPQGLAFYAGNVFVTTQGGPGFGRVGKYNATTGATVNAAFVSGLNGPKAIAAFGGKLFVTDAANTIGEYDAATGATLNASLVTGLNNPSGVAVSSDGADLFVTNFATNGGVGEYTTSGATVNASFVALNSPYAVAFATVPVPPLQVTAAVSRKTHGTAGTFDINLPLTGARGVECRSGGANGNYTMVFSFTNPLTSVSAASASATVAGGGTQAVTISSSAISNTDAHQYVVNLNGVPNAQYTTVSLSNIQDSLGNTTSAASASMGVLAADTTADGNVNSGDIAQTKSKSGATVSASNFRSDVTADGNLNSGDIALVKSKSGTGLPTPP